LQKIVTFGEKNFVKPKFTEKNAKRTEMNKFCKKLYCLEKKIFVKPKFTEKNGKRTEKEQKRTEKNRKDGDKM